MSGEVIAVIIIVVVVVLLGVVAVAMRPALRTRRLRSRFGPEYERVVEQSPDRRAAEKELADRERRHSTLELRSLSEDEQQRYRAEWDGVQERFVDAPAEAVTAADRLLTALMADRGYPTESHDQQIADLSVEHAEPLGSYRAAHEIAEQAGSDASTEDLRTAIVHYRELFEELLGSTSATKPASQK
ncbi:hypothetical protein [Nocardia alni]|uniref:hypothetical protein n=1 Tax=Nocardia alni TaxID=2815723 RepID=UPI0020B372C3|nr:hypothetical protein [Nocardia alni]